MANARHTKTTASEPNVRKLAKRLGRAVYKGAYHACKWCHGAGCLACDQERKKDNALKGGHKARPNEGARA